MLRKEFPDDFLWGVATSAYQIEGGDLKDGMGPSNWSLFTKKKGTIVDGSSGDIACDFYNRYNEDLKYLYELNVNSYRFSISWSRIFPDKINSINQKGVDFYHRIIDNLIEKGIKPFVTIFHYDIPQYIVEKYNGWESERISDIFRDYAFFLFKEYGDKVKYWITLNQPLRIVQRGYIDGIFPPGYKKDYKRAFQVAHNLLLAHGKAVKVFKETVKNGQIGISNSSIPVYSFSQKKQDIYAAKIADQFFNGWYYVPLFKARYPADLFDILDKNEYSPYISEGDMKIISSDIDFWGVNYYSRLIVRYDEKSLFKFKIVKPVKGKFSKRGAEVYPDGIKEVVQRIYYDYGKKDIYITENGIDLEDKVEDNKINDKERIDYILLHLKKLKEAIDEGTKVKGYFYWTLIDNFEWVKGYTLRFGLIYVDRKKNLKRIPKESFYFYKNFLT